jgi:hypothetical protein
MNMYGVIDFSLIDTMPGGTGAFAPPSGWQGDYRQFLLARFKGDCGARQHIAVVGRRLFIKIEGKPSKFLGPHAVEAREFALSVWSSKKK